MNAWKFVYKSHVEMSRFVWVQWIKHNFRRPATNTCSTTSSQPNEVQWYGHCAVCNRVKRLKGTRARYINKAKSQSNLSQSQFKHIRFNFNSRLFSFGLASKQRDESVCLAFEYIEWIHLICIVRLSFIFISMCVAFCCLSFDDGSRSTRCKT